MRIIVTGKISTWNSLFGHRANITGSISLLYQCAPRLPAGYIGGSLMSVMLSGFWSPCYSGRIDRHRGASWSSSSTRRQLVQCWKTSDIYHTALQYFSSAALHPTTAKCVQLNPTTEIQMSTSECRNASRNILPFSLVYPSTSEWGNFWAQCGIQIIIFKTYQYTYHPWGHIILFRLPLHFCHVSYSASVSSSV